ncbi:MAG: family transcriptional regulator, cyclic receptor protein [Solirubrobacteraceae bacterium]|jgi:CRP-like cAMP-binding protein|nr:family transcriptional regulator, cyclic receptor protein [Solirubrobacteraceae bacterium]
MTLTDPAFATRSRTPRSARPLSGTVALADVLPELDDLAPDRGDHARRAVHTPTLGVRRGAWDAADDARAHGSHGFVIVSGAVLRRVVAGHREGAELLGPGDLIQPATESEDDVTWRAVTDVVLGALTPRVLAQAGAVPELLSALLISAVARTNAVARQLVLAQWSSADDRLLATFRILADRWGVVTPDGIALPAFLTHSVLAPLVGARRPSVTTALKRLTASGAVRRGADGRWLVAQTTL